MKKIIRERYIFMYFATLLSLYAGGVVGVDIIRRNNMDHYIVTSNIVFFSFFALAVVLGIFLANKRRKYINDEAYQFYYGATTGTRVVYCIIGISVIALYILLSINMKYPPYFLLAVILMIISRVFWDKLYITDQRIIIGNSVIEKCKVELAEIENRGMNKRIKFVIEGKEHTIDFWREELQDHIINGI